jgi:hypothetical protein
VIYFLEGRNQIYKYNLDEPSQGKKKEEDIQRVKRYVLISICELHAQMLE